MSASQHGKSQRARVFCRPDEPDRNFAAPNVRLISAGGPKRHFAALMRPRNAERTDDEI